MGKKVIRLKRNRECVNGRGAYLKSLDSKKAPPRQTGRKGIEQMQYKDSKKIMIDQRKLETLFRIGCPDSLIIDLLKTGTFTHTGDSLIDDTLESLIDYRTFENWGGVRTGAGRKPKNSTKNNQLEIQDENQLEIQDANQLDRQVVDIDIDNKESIGGMGGKREKITEDTMFEAGGQLWTMPLQFRKLAKKYWSEEEIHKIEQKHSCHEGVVWLCINDLLVSDPPVPKQDKITPPSIEDWLSFCKDLHLRQDVMESQFYAYQDNNWKDSRGKPIKNWKMKIRQVWDKPENKDPDADIVGEVKIIELEE